MNFQIDNPAGTEVTTDALQMMLAKCESLEEVKRKLSKEVKHSHIHLAADYVALYTKYGKRIVVRIKTN